MQQVERMANEAVFILQMKSRDAIRYIQRNAGVSEQAASDAFKSAVLPNVSKSITRK